MEPINRRNFLKVSAATAVSTPVFASAPKTTPRDKVPAEVNFTGDGIHLSPAEYAQLLAQLTQKGTVQADSYSLHGCVEELETKFARLLGKPSAIFMPTGTLANHLAIRTLAGNNRRVIVQNESHVYCDTGDSSQTLSQLNLIPLGTGKATFTLEEVQEILEKTAVGRVARKVGVISIESPVRRRRGELFDLQQLKKICDFARQQEIKLHLDGARLFMASAYTGISPADYAAPFDTVYVSLYKYFNAASGALLAGPKEVIEPMYHDRRMFGSGLPQAWPFALVALHYADGFQERYQQAVKTSEEFIQRLSKHPGFEIERVPSGSNIFSLEVKDKDLKTYAAHLKKRGVTVLPPATASNRLVMQVNETVNRLSAQQLEGIFVESLNS
ncbi:threonine aldolase family protein [Larkinella rosea]|uniref:Aminotransferase class I/II-fold pyridoxal phosphate-dependent enzyme n=1 Tax=Larkinella rosea TaxID=2025312 RepID=A0A3P1BRY3_9BACT|nr:aminotransferase class I/II-fold pyridoxal phosphate-dependent enzyme [Larkinella rosea]RRB03841.1 aminotransferase class I/II-fold pyridoxal phosphate-dependent enzyme [Larkinella rosea]